ncbi:MAG: PDZ domain-containing protein, partial [bacterium]|nr:PDZ domain-containing protein [bacterium]
GPLLDSSGRLIGMNTMIFSKSGSSAGIGFAVPVATIRRVVPQIIEHGKVRRAVLGIDRVPDSVARRHGVEGVVIREVTPRGPADGAGLRGLRSGRFGTALGDVIIGVDDVPIRDFDDLYGALDLHEPGDTVRVRIRRDNSVFETQLTLAGR